MKETTWFCGAIRVDKVTGSHPDMERGLRGDAMAEVEKVSSWWCGTVRVDHVTGSDPNTERYTISCGRERMQLGPQEYMELRSCMECMGRDGVR